MELVEEAVSTGGVIVTEDFRGDDDDRVDGGAGVLGTLSRRKARNADAGNATQDQETNRP